MIGKEEVHMMERKTVVYDMTCSLKVYLQEGKILSSPNKKNNSNVKCIIGVG